MLDAPGVDDVALVAELQGRFLAAGLVATSIRQYVEQNLAASQSFFRLMQGFLALGLLVGITGLGVVMVRAVRERRRTIGVLRALGFRAKAVERAFMAESTFVAAEGILIGAVLAVITTYLLYRNSAAFQGLHGPYPIVWRDVSVILAATFGASILATLGPAKRGIEDPARRRGAGRRLSGTMPMQEAAPIVGARDDYDSLLDLVGNRRLVLLGEATHGTHDFYRERARITKRLIDEKGFNAVAVEADWPDAYRVNRYVMGESTDVDALSALSDFQRFPAWMWRNRDVCGFVEWLRARNDSFSDRRTKARFYGLDLYSLRASMEAVITYLDVVDAEAADAARARYSCFDHVGDVGARYGRAIALDLKLPCEDEVVAQLTDLQGRRARLLASDGSLAEDELFHAEQNAVLVRDAEQYYREMYRADVSSWNLRDHHMAAALRALVSHLDRQLGRSRIVVWEHNSHVGDAARRRWGRPAS